MTTSDQLYHRRMVKTLMIKEGANAADLDSLKRSCAAEWKISYPTNIELLRAYHDLISEKEIQQSDAIEEILRTRPVRSLSGVVNVSLLTKPYVCPGKCIFCPLEKGIPKSYLSGEPAVERARMLHYNAWLQVHHRLSMLEQQGHPTDKVEIRIVGGTWSVYPLSYQERFIKQCFDACNESDSDSLAEAQKKNETAKRRVVSLSIETREDHIHEKEVQRLRMWGATFIELGVQTVFEDILQLNMRGSSVQDTIRATKLLKDAGFKVLYQIMPNLPGSTIAKDEECVRVLFSNPDFQPDMLKIYPCALLKESPLYHMRKRGQVQWDPYTDEEIISLAKRMKLRVPPYCRIQRITRDIPSPRIETGPAKISNLRQVLQEDMQKNGWQCSCIRCRETKARYNPAERIFLFRQEYEASGGKEIFLSFENKDRTQLYSHVRLRIPSHYFDKTSSYIFPVLKDAALIRQVQTYGQLHPLRKDVISPQHKGLGKRLLAEAERIAREEFRIQKMAVIAAIGVRPYFRSLGYRLQDTYMVKRI